MAKGESNGQSNQENLVQGKGQYLLAPRRGAAAAAAGIRPMSAGDMQGLISRIPGIETVRVIQSTHNALSTFSAGADEATNIHVVKIDVEQAEALKSSAPPHLIIEEDAYLDYGGEGIGYGPQALPRKVPRSLEGSGFTKKIIRFKVLGEGDKPLPQATVSLTGDGFPQEGHTDNKGEIALELLTIADRTARSLHVRPLKNHWDTYIKSPQLSDSNVNVVRLKSFSESIPGVGFPDRFRYGWGQKIMGLDLLDDNLSGKGVKIAIIDSGADNRHPLLKHIQQGADFTNLSNLNTWTTDVIGHGSHCAGIITGYAGSPAAFRGFAPEAEIHVLKVFPGGQFSSLLDALDYCIQRNIDVVNMSLGSSQKSQTVDQKIQEAIASGVACIVAAGNSGGPVQFPGSLPYVLTVAAVGKLNESFYRSWDNSTVDPTMVSGDGIFSPTFTCFGPEVDVCAPGVGVISTVPDNSYEAQSGTSMAAPHVTGLAALLLAHHPLFTNQLQFRNQQRVLALFNLVRSICMPYNFGQGRSGAGIPRLQEIHQMLQPNLTQPSPGAGMAGMQPLGGSRYVPANVYGGVQGGFVPFQATPPISAPTPIGSMVGAGAPLGSSLGSLGTPLGFPGMVGDPRIMGAYYNWLLGR